MAVIFDLDQTLVDTKKLKIYRDNRQWKTIQNHLDKTHLYPDVDFVLSVLYENDIPMAVVTNSPGMYAKALLKYHKIPIDTLFAYHDTKKHKPDPEPMLKAVQAMGCMLSQVISLDDDPKDIQASRNADIISCAALWDCENAFTLMQAQPVHFFETPREFLQFSMEFHGLYM